MEELLNKIKNAAESMIRDASLQEKKGNKAAGLRARKASLALEPMLKEFRKMSIAKMKGLAGLLIIASFAGTACVSCEHVDPTDLTEENLPVKSIVCGHVRYLPSGSDPYSAEVGLDVNIFYGEKDDKGNVTYAAKSVKTRQDGYFEATVGCPVGKSLEVKVECRGTGDSQTTDAKGKKVTESAFFYATVSKTVDCGMAAYFAMDMVPSAYTGSAGLTQP